MFKNYLKIAWKVLLRRKFFTFISLFGISFTLMVLMVATSMIDYSIGSHAPEVKTDQLVYINRLKMTGEGYSMNSSPGYYFLDKYVRSLKSPQDVTIYSRPQPYNAYVNNRKMELEARFTDSNHWDVLDYNFVEGAPYRKNDVVSISRVAVINEATRDKYFGEGVPALGKSIEIDRTNYEVVGVVENIAATRLNTFADVWIPYTNMKEDFRSHKFGGPFEAILLAKTPGDVNTIKREFSEVMESVTIPVENGKNYKNIYVHADTIFEVFVRGVTQADEEVNLFMFSLWLFLAMLLFMLLPTINLVNINISRIMERASEIGVRKAFGASSSSLVVQFLVENVILTLIGGLFGLLLAYGVLNLINDSGIIPYADLNINPTVFAFSFFICVFFGIVSGVYPAYKMSKLPAVAALRGGIK